MTAPDQDPASVLRLLVRANVDAGRKMRSLAISGVTWAIAEYADVAAADVPPYACVSYSWGPGRTRNPFGGERATSERTVAVIDAAVALIQPDAMWIDAISVPDDEPARTRCLRSMGAIYGAAKSVIVVLSSPISNALQALAGDHAVDDEEVLLALEADDWVSRAWTYQELVNSAECWFITESGAGPIAANPFLDAFGLALSKYKQAHGLDAFGMRQAHPRLDALESLIADRERSMFLERSAYQVMSAMEDRSTVDPDDKYPRDDRRVDPRPASSGRRSHSLAGGVLRAGVRTEERLLVHLRRRTQRRRQRADLASADDIALGHLPVVQRRREAERRATRFDPPAAQDAPNITRPPHRRRPNVSGGCPAVIGS